MALSSCSRFAGDRPRPCWRRSVLSAGGRRAPTVLCHRQIMPSLEESLFQALEEERKLSEERALLPGLLQHDLANVLCHVSLAASMAVSVKTEIDRARYMREVEGGLKRMNELLSGMRFLFLTRDGSL